MYFQSPRDMYVELNPGLSLLADAMSELIEFNGWKLCCLLVQYEYAMDIFVQAFKMLAKTADWSIEYFLRFHTNESVQEMHYKMLKLQENKCRILILHASTDLSEKIFQVANQDGLLGQGFAWFLTDTAYTSSVSELTSYPVGLLAFRATDPRDSKHLIGAIGSHVRDSLIRFNATNPGVLKALSRGKSCFKKTTSPANLKLASLLER